MSKKDDIKNKSYATLPWAECQRELARELHALRLARGVKQADLARQAGVSRSTLSSLEHGGRATLETLLRVLCALGALDQVERLLADLAAAREAAGITLDDILAQEARKGAPQARQRVRRRIA